MGRHGKTLVQRYQDEWAAELRSRGITPNGTEAERRVARALLDWAPPRSRRITWKQALRKSAQAWARAQKKGTARYVEPNPFTSH